MKIKQLGAVFLMACTVVSCSKKGNDIIVPVSYAGAKLISFNNYTDGSDYGIASESIPFANAWDTLTFEVKVGNTTGTASAPIKVTLKSDENAIINYNNTNSIGNSLQSMPVSGYYFVDEVATIGVGKRTGTFRVAFNPAKFAGGNALGVSIVGVSGDGATVHGDDTQNRLVIQVLALNQWDGDYTSSKGYFYHPSAPRAIPTGSAKTCTTNGANSVYTELGDFDGVNQGAVIYYVTLTIDAANKVTIGPGPGAAPGNPVTDLPGLPAGSGYTPFAGSTPTIYNNTWDPATKTFYLRYGYTNTAGAWRVIEEVLKKN